MEDGIIWVDRVKNVEEVLERVDEDTKTFKVNRTKK